MSYVVQIRRCRRRQNNSNSSPRAVVEPTIRPGVSRMLARGSKLVTDAGQSQEARQT